jgi:hypothetical protein
MVADTDFDGDVRRFFDTYDLVLIPTAGGSDAPIATTQVVNELRQQRGDVPFVIVGGADVPVKDASGKEVARRYVAAFIVPRVH